MKKALIIIGSARKGSSLHIGEFAQNTLLKSGIDAELIRLADYRIDYCDGCLKCDETGICIKCDDMVHLIEKVRIANGIIFVSPTRWSLLSGDMKVFMDRWNPLAGKGLFDDKKSLIVAVGQTNRSESASIGKALEALRFFSDDAGFQFGGEFAFEECLTSTDILSKTNEFSAFGELLEDFART